LSSLAGHGGGHRDQVVRVIILRAVIAPRPARVSGYGGYGGSYHASALRERRSQELCRGLGRLYRRPSRTWTSGRIHTNMCCSA
jgi:hypothetical protein